MCNTNLQLGAELHVKPVELREAGDGLRRLEVERGQRRMWVGVKRERKSDQLPLVCVCVCVCVCVSLSLLIHPWAMAEC